MMSTSEVIYLSNWYIIVSTVKDWGVVVDILWKKVHILLVLIFTLICSFKSTLYKPWCWLQWCTHLPGEACVQQFQYEWKKNNFQSQRCWHEPAHIRRLYSDVHSLLSLWLISVEHLGRSKTCSTRNDISIWGHFITIALHNSHLAISYPDVRSNDNYQSSVNNLPQKFFKKKKSNKESISEEL